MTDDETRAHLEAIRAQARAEYYAENPEHLNVEDDGHAAAILRRVKRSDHQPYLKRGAQNEPV